MGLLGYYLTDIFQNWHMVDKPGRAVLSLVVVIIVTLAVGFLPYNNNWSNLGGLLVGIALGLILVPRVRTRTYKLQVCIMNVCRLGLPSANPARAGSHSRPLAPCSSCAACCCWAACSLASFMVKPSTRARPLTPARADVMAYVAGPALLQSLAWASVFIRTVRGAST
jgi:hypothetical protein